MFLGEASCMAAFLIMRRRQPANEEYKSDKFSPFLFLAPAMCDMAATSCMYAGLQMSYASVFQMLRGTVVLFTGIFSVVFLGRKLHGFHWLAMFLVLIGAAVVGVASLDGGSDDGKNHVFLGEILIVLAQMIVATQMCLEEYFLSGKKIHALQAVGWEGIWGFSMLSLLLIGMNYWTIDGYPIESAPDAFEQVSHSSIIIVAMLGNIVSIAFFNFCGISVTKQMSASHRMVLDSVRTVVVWAVSLAVGWEKFKALQLLGFAILLAGTCIFNEIFKVPYLYYPPSDTLKDEQEKLLANEEGSLQA